MPNHYIAIVPAAGIGSRMQATIAKQYLKLGSKTVIEHSLSQLLTYPNLAEVVVALHPEDNHFSSLEIASHPKLRVVTGGDERVDSVLAALKACPPDAIALVHDAARPCLRHTDIDALIAKLEHSAQAAILARPATDTIKSAHGSTIAKTLPREHIWGAQTPQASGVATLIYAIEQAMTNTTVTDEASALEFCDIPVELVAGSSDNIKITHPEDLALAEFYLQQQGRL
ncbi:MAG: 2-C-methyl-D-erythritol 4-phosphate cytidylyltransferase [Alteromonadaceae bacterium]|nr:2-C-methyl-D-erythritol 4-phosphate cytidylyltransferase [Alteromonadaceae bacterium]